MYNDGGYSGGSLGRPDLQRLMNDIRAGRLDIVVVYKVDRLTRSLADFAKLVELFDAHGVSFVSVTQAFNTTSSMGRLTLNVLLSFAQFEREVTGERIRDKIAASKKKGIRMGGPVPLGYSLRDKKLIIDETEAATVRSLFEGYLEHGTLTALMRHLDGQGIVTKRMIRRDGSIRGGVRFGKGALAYLLRNRVYIGEIVHKGQHYPGEHPPIIDRARFDAVQDALTQTGDLRSHRRFRAKEIFPLADRIYDDRGNRMTPMVARKNGAHYRYHVSSALSQGRHAEAGTITRVAAQHIEDIIAARLQQHHLQQPISADAAAVGATGHMPRQIGTADIDPGCDPMPDTPTGTPDFSAIDRVVVTKAVLHVTFKLQANQTPAPLAIPWSPTPHRRRRAIILPNSDQSLRPIRAETRARLLLGIAKARRWVDDLITSRATDTQTIADREGCSERSVRAHLALAFLAPAIVRAALAGTLPARAVINAPMTWEQQGRQM